MTRSVLVAAALGLPVLLLVAAAPPLMQAIKREARLTARLLAIRGDTAAAQRASASAGGGGPGAWVVGLGHLVARSGLLSRATVETLQHTLSAGGLRGPNALGMFVGSKLLLLLGLPLVALLLLSPLGVSPMARNLGCFGAAVLGLLAPDWWVRRRHAAYVKAVANGLADALDMMVICAEAGLGFEAALARVGREIKPAHPAVAAEFLQTVGELRVAVDSRAALVSMGTRTGLSALKRVASVLTSSMQYGTPLGQALRILSAEMRQETLVRFEARAARLPVLLTLPMVVFILPCIFLIVGGPAVIQALHALHH